MLGQEGAYVDGIYFCPHHPHKGHKGEVADLKTDCDCRKPKPGMLVKAAQDYNIDLKNSWMVGDGENDVQAGIAAGCRTALINNPEIPRRKEEYSPNITVDSLPHFVERVIWK